MLTSTLQGRTFAQAHYHPTVNMIKSHQTVHRESELMSVCNPMLVKEFPNVYMH